MNLTQKILKIYPELSQKDFSGKVIELRNDLDEKGDYIAKWEHPTYPKPTQEQLDSVEE